MRLLVGSDGIGKGVADAQRGRKSSCDQHIAI